MSTDRANQAPARMNRRPLLLLGGAGLLVVLAVVQFSRCIRSRVEPGPPVGPVGPPPDPRLTYPTRYRNVRPEVQFVGSATCARCHRRIAASFRHHPMGRALSPAAELVANLIGFVPSGQEPLPAASALAARLVQRERYGPSAHDPFEASGIEYRAEPRGSQIIHREIRYDARRQVVASLEAPVYLAVGSGARGRSYFIARGDSIVESPLTWYIRGSRWDLSPGYEQTSSHFERPVNVGCLYCHANAVEPVTGSANRYRLPLVTEHGIGCERCHGPGQLHVEARRHGDVPDDPDPTIVNPARLEPSLREAVCEQCHLQGRFPVLRAGRKWFDYRPGLPYHLFWSVFLVPSAERDPHKSVTTVELMRVSRCYRMSRGALGCISCHDPHELPAPEERPAYYRQRCLQCHAGNRRASHVPQPVATRKGKGAGGEADGPVLPHAPTCSEAAPVRRQRRDSCIACHMVPLRSSDIAHTANTDHRVPRRNETESKPAPERDSQSGQPRLVHFHRDLLAPGDRSTDRDLGVALAALAIQQGDEPAARSALPLLETALRDWPDDLAALEARAMALGVLGRIRDGAAAYDALLAKAPDQETYLVGAADLAERQGRLDRAADYYRRALAIDPNRELTHLLLARIHLRRGRWTQAAQQLRAALRLNPFDGKARLFLRDCYLRLGDADRAHEESERLRRLSAR